MARRSPQGSVVEEVVLDRESPCIPRGHREKFGNDPAKHRDFSAITHVAKGKHIPPFLILYMADHPNTSAQAQRLANVLKAADVAVTLFGARETTHNKINTDLGLPDDPATKALLEFLGSRIAERYRVTRAQDHLLR